MSTIDEQLSSIPKLLVRVARSVASQLAARRLQPDTTIVLLGRGCAGNACVFAACQSALMGKRSPVEFRPWTATRAAVEPGRWQNSEVWAFSLSGETSEIVHAALWLKACGARVVAITNHDDSPLCRAADQTLLLDIAADPTLAQTTGFGALYIAAAGLCGLPLVPAIEQVSADLQSQLQSAASAELAEFLQTGRAAIWVGRGRAQVAALEAARAQQEVAHSLALGLSTGELHHGLIAALDGDHRVVIFAEEAAGAQPEIDALVTRLLAAAAPFVVVRAAAHDQASGSTALKIVVPETDWARPLGFAFFAHQTIARLVSRPSAYR
jgi:fructoselysine-6-P-deglycase FrlB-like protein